MDQIEWPEIIVFTHTEVLSGSIYISTPKTRLLDELNGGIVSRSKTEPNFISLTKVIIQHFDGKNKEIALVYINKDTIQMAATSSHDTRRGFGGDPDPKSFPYIEKVRTPVKIVMQEYEITGNMHRISHQTVEDVIMEKTTFVPLTDTEVHYTKGNQHWNIPFLAVNKSQILSLYGQDTTVI